MLETVSNAGFLYSETSLTHCTQAEQVVVWRWHHRTINILRQQAKLTKVDRNERDSTKPKELASMNMVVNSRKKKKRTTQPKQNERGRRKKGRVMKKRGVFDKRERKKEIKGIANSAQRYNQPR